MEQSDGKTILVVEDDEVNRKLMRVVLTGRNYQVREAESVSAALAALHDGKPDLLLLDIRLGDGTGFDVVRELRADHRFDDVPAVAITAQAMKGDEGRILAAGFDGYLPKPIDTRALPAVVEHYLRAGRGGGT